MNYSVAIELRRNRVLVAWGGKAPGWLDVEMSEEMNSAERGEWLQSLLKREGVPDGRVLLVVPRREAVLMQLELAVPEATSLSDLHSVAKVNLATHSTMDMHACVLDAVSSAAGRHAVCAAPTELIDRIREDLKHAGRSVAGVTTRAAGIAAMLGPATTEMYVGVGAREIELAVVHHGVPILSRHLNRNSDSEADVAKIAAEAHRTLTSAKLSSGIAAVDTAKFYVEGNLKTAVRDTLSKHIDMPLEEFVPEFSRVPEEVLPLMALAATNATPVLNLRTLRPPAGLQIPAIRVAVGLSVLVAIVLIGGNMVLASQRAGIRSQLDTLRKELVKIQNQERAHLREEARLIHLQGLVQDEPVWTIQNAAIVGILPETGVVLDRLTGAEDRATTFAASRSSSGRRYAGGKWTNSSDVKIDLHASVTQRDLVPELRQRFIDDPRYEVESKGPELPDRLVFRLTSTGVQTATSEGSSDE